MKILKNKQRSIVSWFALRHPLLIPTITFVVLFFVGLLLFVALGSTAQGASDARIVNVFVDREQQTVTTRAKSVDDLLGRLDVDLAAEDIVEPARESPILEDNTQVNVYRARPVKIIDGDRILTQLTAQQAPRLVAADAGIELLPEDEVTFERLEVNVLETSVSEQLSIRRSREIQLNLYGVVATVRTTAATVDELLDEQDITPVANELVQPSGESVISAGLLVSVNRPGVKTLAINEPIPFESQRIDDDSIVAGESSVSVSGQPGQQAVIYEVVEEDGVEVSRVQIQIVVVKQPVTEVVLRGTKIVTPTFNPSVTVSGDKASLMAAAGIAESDFAFVDYIISHESGWRPGVANTSSGAYGLCQSLPASKMASAGADYLTNPVTQLRWCSSYAAGRYGGWEGAYNAWLAQSWW